MTEDRRPMILLYRAPNARAGALLVQALSARGIECLSSGGAASGAFGELSSDALQVDLYVPEEHAEEARRFIEEEQARPREDARAWTCASCGEENEPGFDLCWKCRSARVT